MRLSGPLDLEEQFNRPVDLTITAKVGTERLQVKQTVLQGVYDDPEARKAIEAELRYRLMVKILEKWTPVIKVNRQ